MSAKLERQFTFSRNFARECKIIGDFIPMRSKGWENWRDRTVKKLRSPTSSTLAIN